MSIFESLVISNGSIDKSSASSPALATASVRFMPGPAAATMAMSRRGRLMFLGSTERLGPPKKKAARQHQANQWNDDGAEWIDMRQRIHRETPLKFGC